LGNRILGDSILARVNHSPVGDNYSSGLLLV
jgi:hypothetical protein